MEHKFAFIVKLFEVSTENYKKYYFMFGIHREIFQV